MLTLDQAESASKSTLSKLGVCGAIEFGEIDLIADDPTWTDWADSKLSLKVVQQS
ncbi:hypothetical protein [Phormidesmis sp. 146-33]